MRRARHGVGCLAASGRPCPRKVLGSIAPCNIALFPWHADEFSDNAMYIGPRFRSQIADPGLNVNPAVGLNHEKAVEARSAAGVTTDRDTHSSHLRTDPLAGLR